MSCRPFIALWFVVVLGSAGCVDSTRVGLNNSRAKEWPEARRNRGSDVIANGDDSCSEPESRAHEEMRVRAYNCPAQGPGSSKVLPRK